MTNLTGLWRGAYSYRKRLSATPFEAELRDHGGMLAGIITEMGDSPRSLGVLLYSTLAGDVRGTTVRFTKLYDGVVRSHAVAYEGELIEDGQAIEGFWSTSPRWSGPFRMERREPKPAVEEKRAEEISVR